MSSSSTVVSFRQPDTVDDPLTAVLRDGARRLLAQAIEAEAEAFLATMKGERLPDGRERLVRHGHGPERQVQTGIGPVAVQRAKLRDRGAGDVGAERIRFTSAILPRWARRTRSLDAWDHVMALLADPDQLLAQFDRFAAAADAGSAREQAAEQQLRARLDRTARADKRLLDAYQAGAVSLSELSQRREHLVQERKGLEQQQEEQTRLRQQRLQAEAVRTDVAAFCDRVRSRLADATLTEKQAILQLVIDRIIVGEGCLEIRHVIPLRSLPPGSSGPAPPKTTRLRTDGVEGAALVPRRW